MKLTTKEQEVLEGLMRQEGAMELIGKFFVRPFEGLPDEYRGVPNDILGEQVKAHLTARGLNLTYLNQMKTLGRKSTEENSPIAPE